MEAAVIKRKSKTYSFVPVETEAAASLSDDVYSVYVHRRSKTASLAPRSSPLLLVLSFAHKVHPLVSAPHTTLAMTVKSKKKQAAKLAAQNKPIRPFKSQSTTLPSSSHPNDSETDSDDIPPEDLQITIDVLSILNDDPTPLSRKQYKPLKRAGWEFAKVLAAQGAGSGGTTQSQISHLLSLSLYQQALVLLFELYVTKTPTKLGSLQRWVRDCDATARPGEMLSPEDKEERRMVLRCLDMVLRVCDTSEKKITSLKGKEKAVEWEEAEDDGEEDEKEESYGEGIIRRMKVWDVRKQLESNPNPSHILQPSLPLWSLIQSGYDSTSTPKKSHPSFYPIQTTPGPLRRPPNLYPSTVHASLPSSPIPFPPTSSPIFSLTHPAIPTCSMILNVLPPTTCESIISICNDHLTWEPDQASSGSSAADKSSVLAHNVVWLADEKFVGELFERIKPFVKERIVGGEKGDGTGGRVRGINRRFRVYRYGPKQVYRVSC